MSVALLLVCHDGARWLSQVAEGVRAQTVRPDVAVVVDTGSRDGSTDLIGQLAGRQEIRTISWNASFPEAVRAGLEGLDADWVWILHDDSTPDPRALERLLVATRTHPHADFFGPKLREWPSLKRLLEVGATLSFTGARETGLEQGEYDQGQHDRERQVLAVHSAGMLARRESLVDLDGFDPDLPIFGNDLDLGWRAAWTGRATVVVPDAVVFHAEAAQRGVRRSGLTGRNPRYHQRRAALHTLLANVPGHVLPWLWLRITTGSLLRALGYLVSRAPRLALDEVFALASVILRPAKVRAGRRRRKPERLVPWREIRPLLAPWWLPYRHGADFVSDLIVAATNQAQDVAERRRAAAIAADPSLARTRPSGEDDDGLSEEPGWVVRFFANPVAVLSALFVVLVVVGAREEWHHNPFGALSAAPAGAGDWWRLYAESTHPLLLGSHVPGPGFLLPLAALGALLGGSAGAAISAVMVLSMPIAFWGGYRFLRVVGHAIDPRGAPRWLLAIGAAVFALTPATSGAWGQGRFGTVAAAALLPWLAHAVLGLADPESDRRWRAAWRSGLLLALLAAFAPMAWFFCALFLLVGLGVASRLVPGVFATRSVWGPPVLALLLAPVLLLPWVGPLLWDGPRSALLLEAGRLPAASPSAADLITGRLGPESAAAWLGLLVLVLAIVALVPVRTRIPVVACWITAAVGAAVVTLLAPVHIRLAATSTHVGLGFFVVLFEGVLVTAVAMAATGVVRQGWPLPERFARRATPALIAVLLLAPVFATAWFVQGGHAAAAGMQDAIPAYMAQESRTAPQNGVLVLDGTVESGVGFFVHRGQGEPIGADQVVALTPADRPFSAAVAALVSRPTPEVIATLARSGIEYVVLQAPADGRVAATLDAASGLEQASTEDPASRAWQLVEKPAVDRVASETTVGRRLLLALQVLLLAVAVVMCLPQVRGREER